MGFTMFRYQILYIYVFETLIYTLAYVKEKINHILIRHWQSRYNISILLQGTQFVYLDLNIE